VKVIIPSKTFCIQLLTGISLDDFFLPILPDEVVIHFILAIENKLSLYILFYFLLFTFIALINFNTIWFIEYKLTKKKKYDFKLYSLYNLKENYQNGYAHCFKVMFTMTLY